jgi:hypothetical protein
MRSVNLSTNANHALADGFYTSLVDPDCCTSQAQASIKISIIATESQTSNQILIFISSYREVFPLPFEFAEKSIEMEVMVHIAN